MFDKIITYSFYLLFFLTPLFWTSLNYELFEYNKMILVYGFTVIIVGTWLLKTINDKRLTIKRTPLDIPLILFLGANILSTIFSIDPHTSIWGYYSRSNGGLLSLISYLLLYWAFVSNITSDQIKQLLNIGLVSGLIISIWGISEHFGVSPSCVILRGEFSANCWVQDVQSRVFATLGQPNWMAGYLAMLIFPALYLFLTARSKLSQYTYYLILTTYYLAFTFTYSRGPTLGLIGGMAVLLILSFPRRRESKSDHNFFKGIIVVLLSFLMINLLFGSALTSFRLVSKFAPPPRPTLTLPTTSVTQLETGGTESGQIRFIVWKGALDIFKNYPIFGSGVETFAQVYYRFRPVVHNLTSEWDFLYNKAHNEYLNYLATTGIVGFGTYLLVIGTFIIWSFKKLLKSKFQNPNFKSNLNVKKLKNLDFSIHLSFDILILALLASYISYLIYNFFLFSVVIIAIFFYLFPALAFVATDSTKPFKVSSSLHLLTSIFRTIYHRPLYTKIAKGIVIFLTIFLLYSIFQLWYADTIFNLGQQASEAGNPGRAYNLFTIASQLNKAEPFYRSELAYSAAAAAAALKDSDASLSAQLGNQAISEMERVLQQSSKNVSFWRTAVRTYFELATIDQNYIEKTLEALDRAITLAPTDPKLYYNKALILYSQNQTEESVKTLQKAIELKPNYQEALIQLKEATSSSKP